MDAAIEGMVGCLDDPYSMYISSEESESFSEELNGEYVGIGARIIKKNDGDFIVYEIFDNSPAYKSGLKKDDQIIKINGENVSDKSSTDLVSLIKNVDNSNVEITVKRNNEELKFNIKTGSVDLPSVEYRIINNNDSSIAVINISVFAANTYKQFNEAVNKIGNEKIDGLIIDLRGNTGGYLTVAQSIIEMFVNNGDIMYQLDTKGKVSKIVNRKEPIIKYKTVLLVNKTTASASEILTASLKENLGSEVIGVTTYGKGKVQKFRTLSNGSMIKYTIQNWLTPSGKEIDGNGIKPTIEVELNKDFLYDKSDEKDNQLQQAIKTIVNYKKNNFK
ncbi:MAG: S41 family peptidase [bacterium]|nr:S41 family peptidase [bacterium]